MALTTELDALALESPSQALLSIKLHLGADVTQGSGNFQTAFKVNPFQMQIASIFPDGTEMVRFRHRPLPNPNGLPVYALNPALKLGG